MKANGIWERFGRMEYSNGDMYEIEWKNDKRQGQGTYTWKAGEEYIVEYKENMRDWEGIYTVGQGIAEIMAGLGLIVAPARKIYSKEKVALNLITEIVLRESLARIGYGLKNMSGKRLRFPV